MQYNNRVPRASRVNAKNTHRNTEKPTRNYRNVQQQTHLMSLLDVNLWGQ